MLSVSDTAIYSETIMKVSSPPNNHPHHSQKVTESQKHDIIWFIILIHQTLGPTLKLLPVWGVAWYQSLSSLLTYLLLSPIYIFTTNIAWLNQFKRNADSLYLDYVTAFSKMAGTDISLWVCKL